MKKIKLNTILGDVFLVASEKGIVSLLFQDKYLMKEESLKKNIKIDEHLIRAKLQVKEYLAGKRKKFDLPLDLRGTAFQEQVWKNLLKIPYGKTCSYKDIALKMKNEKSVRAIGGANGKNQICIIIPCHRVINADGKLGGYSGGLDKKIKLLELESKT